MDGQSLLVANLLNDTDGLCSMLGDAARAGAWLDAYLVAAGINQIAEDRLHSAPYPVDDAASFLRGSRSGSTRMLGTAAAGCGRTARAVLGSGPGSHRLRDWQRRLAGTVDELAGVVAGAVAPDQQLADRCHAIAEDVTSLPDAVRATPLRLPACFHSFDQRPEDMALLAARYGEREDDRGRPVLVVGVRTSGSYLAPLLAAFLRADGRARTRALTLRPRHALLRSERAIVSATVRGGGAVLLTDDPPVTGASLAQAARALERCGVPSRRIVICLGLTGERPPATIEAYRTVSLGPAQWAIDPWLRADLVRTTLASLLGGELGGETVEPLALPAPRTDRGHRRSLWRVRGRDLDSGRTRQLDVLVSGVGLGYFGGQALAVSRELSAFSPRVIGLRNGLLYREWLDPRTLLDRPGSASAALIDGATRYIAARRDALPVGRDASTALRGRRPVWEVAGLILGDGFGRGSPVARVAFVDALARRLLRVARPSVVDGATDPRRWFAGEQLDGAILKTALTDRTHWRLGLECFDAAFDLAGVGALSADGTLAVAVRRAWLALTGEDITAERWLLYELAHLWGSQRADPEREADVRRAAARALQRYFAEAFLAGIPPREDGPLVALDIDGVLETEIIGWPSLTRASAIALRALLAHGYRPIPVTGRGLDEVRDRCHAYRLAGAVAEYGCVIYLTEGDRSIPLVQPSDAAALDRLRAVLGERGGILLDPVCRHSLRAYRVRRDGSRRPLDAQEIDSALTRAAAAGVLTAIRGQGQTDFVPAAVDKGRGLAALTTALGRGSPRVALAVGDSLADRPMLRLGDAAFVPAHAPAGTEHGPVRRLTEPYQAGLAAAVAALLGHRPGECARCRQTTPEFERAAVVGLLSIAEAGRRKIPRETGRLLGHLSTSKRRFSAPGHHQPRTTVCQPATSSSPDSA